MALWNVTTRRRTIWPVRRKQGTLPWDIPPTVSVCNRLFRYLIDGWPTSRSGVCFLASSNSVRQSSKSFCRRITAISNSIFGEHRPSVPPSSCGRLEIGLSEYSRGLSVWLSGMSLPDVVLSGPSDVNKERFRGISHRLSLCATVSSGI